MGMISIGHGMKRSIKNTKWEIKGINTKRSRIRRGRWRMNGSKRKNSFIENCLLKQNSVKSKYKTW